MLQRVSPFYLAILLALILKADCVNSEDLQHLEYDYGDRSIAYDALHRDEKVGGLTDYVTGVDYPRAQDRTLAVKQREPIRDEDLKGRLPLCCSEGKVYDQVKCTLPPSDFDWIPKLNGAPGANFYHSGFPKCVMKDDFIQTYQTEVHFMGTQVFLPYYIWVHSLDTKDYCIAKVHETEVTCENFQTKIFSCHRERNDPDWVIWTSVTLSHFLILFSLIVFFLVSELRCLQGQYMICFLISLLIYNLCLLPGSYLPMDISDVSCIALGAMKYFFFCGVFLWFNVVCFDVWRTMSNKQDIGGRRRFLFYSAYSWTVGAILTTVVLVMPYVNDEVVDNSRNDPIKDSSYDTCKLKVQVNIILQIAQVVSLVLDLIFLILASCYVCSYSKFGNGLPRCDASLCLKQGWKLFFIMFAHMLSCIDTDFLPFSLALWLYLLLESAAVFGVFAYRKTILNKFRNKTICQSIARSNENGSTQEKGQLTVS